MKNSRRLKFRRFLAFFSVICGALFGLETVHAAVACRQAAEPTSQASQQFFAKLNQLPEQLTRSEIEALQKFQLVFVPGFLNGEQAHFGNRPFAAQVDWLKNQGVDSVVFTYNIASPEKTLQEMNDQLKSDKPVFVVSYSMGSILTMQLLVARPEWQAQVGGWLSINGTLKGSPLADLAYKPLHRVLPNGFRGALENQTEKKRQQYAIDHQEQLESLLQNVPSLFATTWTQSSLKIPRKVIERSGHDWSDGLVPTHNAYLGCLGECVVLPNTSHFSVLQDLRIFRTLLNQILQKVQK